MLRLSLAVTRVDRIRNNSVRGTAQVEGFGDQVRGETMRWVGHVQRRYSGYIE